METRPAVPTQFHGRKPSFRPDVSLPSRIEPHGHSRRRSAANPVSGAGLISGGRPIAADGREFPKIAIVRLVIVLHVSPAASFPRHWGFTLRFVPNGAPRPRYRNHHRRRIHRWWWAFLTNQAPPCRALPKPYGGGTRAGRACACRTLSRWPIGARRLQEVNWLRFDFA